MSQELPLGRQVVLHEGLAEPPRPGEEDSAEVPPCDGLRHLPKIRVVVTAELLIQREVRAIVCAENNISDQAMEAFLDANIPILFQMPIRQIDDIAVTYYDELQRAITAWEEKREEIQRNKTEEKLGTLIAEYQSKRKQELETLYQLERKKKKDQQIQQKVRTIEKKEVDER